MDLTRASAALVFTTIMACASTRAPASIPSRLLPATDGGAYPLVDARAKLTVIEFFSAHCPVQSAHDARLRELVTAYAPRGVAFRAVDSEAGADVERDRAEASKRGYAFPILIDQSGSVARAIGAQYSTYALVVDREGNVLYAGGLDSDVSHLTPDATPYLRDALDDALEGRPVRTPSAKTLGCALTLE